MSSLTHHPDRGVVYVGPSLSSSLLKVAAADGVACAVCHQAEPQGLGTPDSYNGNLTTAPSSQRPRPLYGPYAADARSISIHNLASGLTVTRLLKNNPRAMTQQDAESIYSAAFKAERRSTNAQP